MKDLVGTQLQDRYQVVSFIGRGGMAEVYQVWDSERMIHLAAKVLLKSLALDRVFMRRFAREAQSLSRLQHPHIVRYYGFFQQDKLAVMLLDYIDGMTLQEKIYEDGLNISTDFLQKLVIAVCGALNYAHRQGLVHCDIKPGNIMMDRYGKVLLTDFGIARMTDAATATMVGFGTPAYMAPELVRGQDPTPHSDIYSLGVVLYELVTGGERPFTGERAQASGTLSEKVRWEQVHPPPVAPRAYNQGLSAELEAVILCCLEKDPRQRFQTPFDVVHGLAGAICAGSNLLAGAHPAPLQAATRAQLPEDKAMPLDLGGDHALEAEEKQPSQGQIGENLPEKSSWVDINENNNLELFILISLVIGIIVIYILVWLL